MEWKIKRLLEIKIALTLQCFWMSIFNGFEFKLVRYQRMKRYTIIISLTNIFHQNMLLTIIFKCIDPFVENVVIERAQHLWTKLYGNYLFVCFKLLGSMIKQKYMNIIMKHQKVSVFTGTRHSIILNRVILVEISRIPTTLTNTALLQLRMSPSF